jgi:hypothetical protein
MIVRTPRHQLWGRPQSYGPDGNNVELNVNYHGNEWTATEHMKAF